MTNPEQFGDSDHLSRHPDLYQTPYLDINIPEIARYDNYEGIPGISVKKTQKGVPTGVTCSNYNAFAQYMVRRFDFKNADGSVFGWDGDHRIAGDAAIDKVITQIGFDVFDTYKTISEALQAIEREARHMDVTEASHFIGFKNGTYDVLTDTWTEGATSNPTLYTIPHDFDPQHKVDPDTSIMYQCLWTLACGRQSVFDAMCQVIGFAMSSVLETREVPILVSPGQHGKSTFLEIIMSILGDDLICNKSVHELCDRFGLNDLRGKALNLADDEDVSVLDPATVRRLKIVGSHGKLFADRKGINGVEFRVTQKLIMASNAVPRTSARDANNGLWDRLVPIPFDADFSDTGTIRRDPGMRLRLATDEAIQDAMALGIEGVKMMRENGWRIVQPEETRILNLQMRMVSDTTLAWVEDEAVDWFDYNHTDNPLALAGAIVNDVYEMYERWCRRGNVKPVAKSSFPSMLAAHCPGLVTTKQRVCLTPGAQQTIKRIFWNGQTVPDNVYTVQFDPFVQNAAPVGIASVDRRTGKPVANRAVPDDIDGEIIDMNSGAVA